MKLTGKFFKYFILFIFSVLILLPIFIAILSSLKTTSELYNNPLGFPSRLNFENYINALIKGNLYIFFKNSLIITVVSIAADILFASLIAFVVTRRDFIVSRLVYMMFIIGLMVPYQIAIIPLYLTVANFKLTNNLIGLMIVYVVYGLPFSVFVMEGFFRQVPKEIEESAIVDGCNIVQTYAKIIMPLSKSVIVSVVIFMLVWVWNDMFYPLVFIKSNGLKTLSLGIIGFKGEFNSDYTTLFAGVVLVSIPIATVYLMLQKQFVQGITAGAVKG